MSEQIYAAIDLEMTGLKPGFDEIIEVGIVHCTPDRVLERWSSLVRPLEPPSLRIQRITGITPLMLEQAPAWQEIESEVRSRLQGATLVGHNVPFDERFLEAAGIEVGKNSIDTLPLAQIIDPMAPSHRLGDLCAEYGIQLNDAHRALDDAEAARQLLVQLRARYADLPDAAREALDEVASAASLAWAPGRVLREWSRDAPQLTSNAASRRRESPPPLEPTPLPSGSLAELTQQAFASVDDHDFEQREEQLAMARDVAESLQHGDTLIVEAGTGTGKSLAYLVPAALWALKTGNTVVVSTHTINLQQQLMTKDIEFARRLIAGVSKSATSALMSTVVKGRGNYLCQQRLDRQLGAAADWNDPLVLARAAVWRALTAQGDRAELRLAAPLERQWDQLSANDTSCLSDRNCQYAMNGECFLLRIQQLAASSHIVIANHALLVRSLVSGAITMPEAAVVIVDESHALENVATDQLSLEMSESWVLDSLHRCAEGSESTRRRAEDLGLRRQAAAIKRQAGETERLLGALFEDLAKFASDHSTEQVGNEDRVTLSAGARNNKDWSELELSWEQVQASMKQLAATVDEIARDCMAQANEKRGVVRDEWSAAASEAHRQYLDLTERAKTLSRAMTELDSEQITWLTREHRRQGAATVHAAPLSVAEQLKPLWLEQHATVLTGATLATSAQPSASFDYLKNRLGIEDAAESQYGSPFDYERRCRVYLPTDMLDADDPEYHDAVAAAIKSLAIAAGGRTMVLFRSYNAMNQVTRRVAEDLERAGLVLIRQGRDGSAASVVETLRSDPRTVVFGVAALWTGVDVPGDALSLLIITRLPFVPPNDPVLRARGEQYENEFMEFTLPAAILQFRQGIGRLIRTQSDIGAAVILDGRIATRRYGSQFLDALPPAPVIREPLSAVAKDIREFLPPIRERT